MLVSQVSSTNFKAGRWFGLTRKNHCTVTKFELPITDSKKANVLVKENVAKGIVQIAYEILQNGKSVEARSVASPNGIKSGSYRQIVSDIQSKTERKDFFMEFLRAKSKLG